MVVIVNAARTVDKRDFFHKLKGLRTFQLAGQILYPARTKTGQKKFAARDGCLRTFRPVDIHGLIHIAVEFGPVCRVLVHPGSHQTGAASSSLAVCGQADQAKKRSAGSVDVAVGTFPAMWPESAFFFRAMWRAPRSQVYNQKLVYRMIVVVNDGKNCG